MALGKWIGGFLGFMVFGPLGALAGYALGSLFDNALISFADGNDGPHSFEDAYRNRYEQNKYSRQQQTQGQRNSFMFSLLVLSSGVLP